MLCCADVRRVLVCCRYGNANTTGEAGKATPTITSNDGLIIGGISDTAVSTTDAAQPSGRTSGTAKSSEEELNHQTKVLRCVPHKSRSLPAACCLLPAVVRYRVHGRSPTLGSPPPPVCVPTRPRRRSRLPWQRTVRSSRPSARASGCRRSWRPGASVARALASWRMRRL